MELINFLQYSFIQKAFFAGSFVAIICAALGLFLVLRKMSLIGDGLSHVSFGAIALGVFFGIYPYYLAIPLVMWLIKRPAGPSGPLAFLAFARRAQRA